MGMDSECASSPKTTEVRISNRCAEVDGRGKLCLQAPVRTDACERCGDQICLETGAHATPEIIVPSVLSALFIQYAFLTHFHGYAP